MSRHYQSSTSGHDDDEYPYVRPCTPQSRKEGKLCVNLQLCRYDIARYVFQYLDFRDCSKPEHYRLTYLDSAPSIEQLTKLSPSQMLSRFPHMGRLCTKGSFFKHMNRMRLCFPNEYRFVPRTWVLPHDNVELQEEFGLAQPHEKPRTYIVKPSLGTQGIGIYLVQRLDQIHSSNDQIVVQRYIDRPFLIDGLKFDFRIYVLVSSISATPPENRSSAAPLWIWIGREGLARFCTKKYDSNISDSNINQAYMHLTNYAVNKTSKNFVANSDVAEDDKGSKRSLSSVTRLLKQKGYDVEGVWNSIAGVIVKTMIAIAPSLLSSYAPHCSQPTISQRTSQQTQTLQFTQHPHSQCFHIIGFDIMLDYRLRPWIIEINHSPSFVTDSPLDRKIKFQVISGAVRLMSILNGKPLDMDKHSSSKSQTSSGDPSRPRSFPHTSPDDFYRNIYPHGTEIVNGQSLAEFMSVPLAQKSPGPIVRQHPAASDIHRHVSREERKEKVQAESLEVVDKMNIFNAAILHESFYRTAGVKLPFGVKTVSDVGYYASSEFKSFYREYAKRLVMAISNDPPRPAHTSGFTSRSTPYMQPTPFLAQQRSVQPVTIVMSRFCQFGRTAGLADGKSFTQADMADVYRDVTRHTARIGSSTNGRQGVVSAGAPARTLNMTGGSALMGYGEFCHALMTLAVQRTPDMSVHDSVVHLIRKLEENFMQNTKMPAIPNIVILPLPTHSPSRSNSSSHSLSIHSRDPPPSASPEIKLQPEHYCDFWKELDNKETATNLMVVLICRACGIEPENLSAYDEPISSKQPPPERRQMTEKEVTVYLNTAFYIAFNFEFDLANPQFQKAISTFSKYSSLPKSTSSWNMEAYNLFIQSISTSRDDTHKQLSKIINILLPTTGNSLNSIPKSHQQVLTPLSNYLCLLLQLNLMNAVDFRSFNASCCLPVSRNQSRISSDSRLSLTLISKPRNPKESVSLIVPPGLGYNKRPDIYDSPYFNLDPSLNLPFPLQHMPSIAKFPHNPSLSSIPTQFILQQRLSLPKALGFSTKSTPIPLPTLRDIPKEIPKFAYPLEDPCADSKKIFAQNLYQHFCDLLVMPDAQSHVVQICFHLVTLLERCPCHDPVLLSNILRNLKPFTLQPQPIGGTTRVVAGLLHSELLSTGGAWMMAIEKRLQNSHLFQTVPLVAPPDAVNHPEVAFLLAHLHPQPPSADVLVSSVIVDILHNFLPLRLVSIATQITGPRVPQTAGSLVATSAAPKNDEDLEFITEIDTLSITATSASLCLKSSELSDYAKKLISLLIYSEHNPVRQQLNDIKALLLEIIERGKEGYASQSSQAPLTTMEPVLPETRQKEKDSVDEVDAEPTDQPTKEGEPAEDQEPAKEDELEGKEQGKDEEPPKGDDNSDDESESQPPPPDDEDPPVPDSDSDEGSPPPPEMSPVNNADPNLVRLSQPAPTFNPKTALQLNKVIDESTLPDPPYLPRPFHPPALFHTAVSPFLLNSQDFTLLLDILTLCLTNTPTNSPMRLVLVGGDVETHKLANAIYILSLHTPQLLASRSLNVFFLPIKPSRIGEFIASVDEYYHSFVYLPWGIQRTMSVPTMNLLPRGTVLTTVNNELTITLKEKSAGNETPPTAADSNLTTDAEDEDESFFRRASSGTDSMHDSFGEASKAETRLVNSSPYASQDGVDYSQSVAVSFCSSSNHGSPFTYSSFNHHSPLYNVDSSLQFYLNSAQFSQPIRIWIVEYWTRGIEEKTINTSSTENAEEADENDGDDDYDVSTVGPAEYNRCVFCGDFVMGFPLFTSTLNPQTKKMNKFYPTGMNVSYLALSQDGAPMPAMHHTSINAYYLSLVNVPHPSDHGFSNDPNSGSLEFTYAQDEAQFQKNIIFSRKVSSIAIESMLEGDTFRFLLDGQIYGPAMKVKVSILQTSDFQVPPSISIAKFLP
ncbi:putative tubulin-tyrosine ligase family protein [Blattamonas nauphoetae]|uniref:Tubulin-tyrosine ligase family protein n=1 Tax=Blattamonas nauphoetae TaxID=2049346 RepID=A0ABQ9Y9I5_9EUKA|nr:putative tubulin-tyrosine ligase family protein [Blattamonas nauphoetae]